MKIQGAVVKEQGVTFAIVVVKPHMLNNSSEATETAASFRSLFGPIPIVLMAQDGRGTPTYFGRKDIVGFLSRIPMSSIPWKEYSVS